MRVPGKLTVAAAALAMGATIQATSLYRADFTGTVTVANIDAGASDGTILAGTPFSGSFVFDAESLDLIAHPRTGNYDQAMPNAFQMQFGGSTAIAPDRYDIFVEDNVAGNDTYAASRTYGVWSGAGASNGLNVDMSLKLGDSSQTALTSDDLLTSIPPLSAWDVKKIQVTSHQGNPNMFIEGELTSLSVQPVPEPATLGAFLTGVFSAYRIRCRRRRR
jgi:hypothetical protein